MRARHGALGIRRSAIRLIMRGLYVLVLVVAACSVLPRTVRITIANSTEYDIEVDVTGQDRQGWLPLAIVEARSEGAIEEVIDQGEVWIFRFEHFGDSVGKVRLTRGELEGSGWRVEIPPEVGQHLQELGRPTSEELTGVEPGDGG
jgi:hypothetical protein